MSSNPIPPELQTDHLFLLVGTNPLPNWVAARVLLKPHGRVHLAYTRETETVAGRLRDSLTPTITVDWEKDCFQIDQAYDEEIFSSITERLKGLSGTVGLNYTGGTKMMSVHAHRAVRDSKLRPEPVFSYLDARTLEMKVDRKGERGWRIGLCDEVRIDLETLVSLHEDSAGPGLPYDTESTCGSGASALVGIHSHWVGQDVWHSLWEDQLNSPKKKYQLKKVDDRKCEPGSASFDQRYYDDRRTFFDVCALPTEKKFDDEVLTHKSSARAQRAEIRSITQSYRELLEALNVNGGSSLKDTVDQGLAIAASPQRFKDSIQLARWLHGNWLEHYTFDQIKACTGLNVGGVGLNLKPVNTDRRRFETDVAALRGYQLYYFSCYSGNTRSVVKSKLFEATVRATQLGGDEALIALVCCGDKHPHSDNDQVDSVRREVDAEWQTTGRIQVFGRKELLRLSGLLQNWFNHSGYTVRR